MTRALVAPEPRERWQHAFPDGCIVAAPDALESDGITSIWLELPAADSLALLQLALAHAVPVICMAAVPDRGQALRLLQAGAQGYCHVEAAPEQLREIAMVVEHGGLWLPSDLMRSFLAMSVAMVPREAPAAVELNELTSRELMVAEQVARGASNREIAAVLSISERTVKAHLTAIFDKLGVRDRVQLALAMNNIATHSTVN